MNIEDLWFHDNNGLEKLLRRPYFYILSSSNYGQGQLNG